MLSQLHKASAESTANAGRNGALDTAWESFTQPQTDADFFQSWLQVFCAQGNDISAAAVLLLDAASQSFVPVAVWPDAGRDYSIFTRVAEDALRDGNGKVQANEQSVHIGYPLNDAGSTHGVIVVEFRAADDEKKTSMFRHVHWGSGWLRSALSLRRTEDLRIRLARTGMIMEVITTGLKKVRLKQTLFDIVNQLCRDLHCSRVGIGLVKHNVVHLAAISDAAWFESKSDAVKKYVAAMEETLDAGEPVQLLADAADDSQLLTPSHRELAALGKAGFVYSMPLVLNGQMTGVIMFERTTPSPFDDGESVTVNAIAGLLPSLIDQKQQAERGYISRISNDLISLYKRLFGSGHFTWKFAAVVVMACVGILAIPKVDYRVTAKTIIEGEVQSAAVAPFQGYILKSFVRAGNIVKKGQVLCVLDDRDLKLERDKWHSEMEQHLSELRHAMADHDLPGIQLYDAKAREAEAQLALVNEQLSRAAISAPFDGVIIAGDLSQLIGSPVDQGKQLFEIAPLQNYRVILEVDEGELRYVGLDDTGSLLITGLTSEPLSFHVNNITPVATAKDGHNYFRVEAKMDNAPVNLRPGMEGIGKIDVGRHRLWWVLTHKFTDWLHLALWRWLP